MKAEEMRVMIAEWCGWTHTPPPPGGFTTAEWRRPSGGYTNHLPNYPADLNAIAEARKKLTPAQRDQFARALHDITEAGWPDEYDNLFTVIDATALQQSEALIRALNLNEQ